MKSPQLLSEANAKGESPLSISEHLGYRDVAGGPGAQTSRRAKERRRKTKRVLGDELRKSEESFFLWSIKGKSFEESLVKGLNMRVQGLLFVWLKTWSQGSSKSKTGQVGGAFICLFSNHFWARLFWLTVFLERLLTTN